MSRDRRSAWWTARFAARRERMGIRFAVGQRRGNDAYTKQLPKIWKNY